jgi:hypothetical protein
VGHRRLAEGLLVGCVEYFGEDVVVRRERRENGLGAVRFALVRRQEQTRFGSPGRSGTLE